MQSRQLVLAPSAEHDLDAYWLQITKDNTIAVAEKQIRELLETAARIAEFPEMGRARTNLGADLWSFPTRSHIIFYRPYDDRLEIARFVPAVMDIEAEMMSFLKDHFGQKR